MKTRQKPMSPVAYEVMKLIMKLRKNSRKVEEEINLANPKKEEVILDFGCGPGFNTIPLAKLVGPKGRIYALDVNKLALNSVIKNCKKEGLTNIFTIQTDSSTGLDTESVDVIYLHNVFPMIEDKKSVIKELMRVMKKGGRLSLVTGNMARRAGNDTMSDSELVQHLTD